MLSSYLAWDKMATVMPAEQEGFTVHSSCSASPGLPSVAHVIFWPLLAHEARAGGEKNRGSLTIGTKQLGQYAPKAGGKADFYEDALEGVVLQ